MGSTRWFIVTGATGATVNVPFGWAGFSIRASGIVLGLGWKLFGKAMADWFLLVGIKGIQSMYELQSIFASLYSLLQSKSVMYFLSVH